MSLWSRIQRQLGELGEMAGELLADDTRDGLLRARELLSSDPRGAIAAAEEVLAQKPEHALALAIIGAAHLELGELQPATSAFDRALTSVPNLPEALLGRGETSLLARRPADALTPYHQAVEQAAGDRRILAEAYRGLGVAYRRLGELDKGIRELRKAVAEDADDPLARAALGEALEARGVFEEARRHLRRAAAAEPVPTLARLALARLALGEGDGEAALAQLDEACAELERARPSAFAAERAPVWTALGQARHQAGDVSGAREALGVALSASPGDAEVLAQLADLALAEGDTASALRDYRRSLERTTRREVLERAVRASLLGGTAEERVELANRLLSVDPSHPLALVARARVLADGGDAGAARATLLMAAEGGEPEAHLALAELERAQGSLGSAADHVLAALRRVPRDERARSLLREIRQDELASVVPSTSPEHVTDAGDAALYRLAIELSSLLGSRAELAALSAEPASAAADFDRPLLVTVMGEFSSGKSSFVNAFIGEDVAPTGITPTTATINVVKYGREPSGRLIYQDGHAESLGWAELIAKLRQLTGRAAAQIAQVEILVPRPQLERVNIVDTPGLNSILPEHEAVARDFVRRADAVIWVFSAAQAGKKSERLALEGIRGAGVRVLGVLNKVDQLGPNEIDEVMAHVRSELGELVDAVVPVSTRRALEARAAGGDPGEEFGALEAQLEERFFTQARALKREALGRRLLAILSQARDRIRVARSADGSHSESLRRAGEQVHDDLRLFLEVTVDRERAAMRQDVEELFRLAAREVLELVRPRRLPFGSHQASPADRDYLIGLLESGYEALIRKAEDRVSVELNAIGQRARGAATSAGGEAAGDVDRALAEATRWLRAQVFGRTDAYVRGYLRGGYVADFFRRDLPKIDLDQDTIYQALYTSSPDLDSVIAVPLAQAGASALSSLAERLHHLADVAELHGFDLDVGIAGALETVEQRCRALAPVADEREPFKADPGDR